MLSAKALEPAHSPLERSARPDQQRLVPQVQEWQLVQEPLGLELEPRELEQRALARAVQVVQELAQAALEASRLGALAASVRRSSAREL